MVGKHKDAYHPWSREEANRNIDKTPRNSHQDGSLQKDNKYWGRRGILRAHPCYWERVPHPSQPRSHDWTGPSAPCIYPEKCKRVHTKALAHIDSSVAHRSRKWTQPRCSSAAEGVDKIWSVLKRECHSAPKEVRCKDLLQHVHEPRGRR